MLFRWTLELVSVEPFKVKKYSKTRKVFEFMKLTAKPKVLEDLKRSRKNEPCIIHIPVYSTGLSQRDTARELSFFSRHKRPLNSSRETSYWTDHGFRAILFPEPLLPIPKDRNSPRLERRPWERPWMSLYQVKMTGYQLRLGSPSRGGRDVTSPIGEIYVQENKFYNLSCYLSVSVV